MKPALLALVGLGCATTPAPARPCAEPTVAVPDDAAAVRAVFTAFVVAVEGRRFDEALASLSSAWRQRYAAARFQADFELEPQGRVLIDRLKAVLAQPIERQGDRAWLVVAQSRRALAERTAEGWKIVTLDDPLP